MPKISVLMPVYNTEEIFLREAIESILNQTYADFEFLIIDDGSTNNTEDIILSYKDERIKYIKNEQNIGLIKTLNKGINLAQGEYIARMDSDDISLPERFAKQVKFLDENPDIDVLGTWFQCLPSGRIVETSPKDKDIKEHLLVNSNDIGHPTVMIRRATIIKYELKYDENALYVEDYALWLSLIDKIKFANLTEVLLNYRIHGNNVCNKNATAQSLNCQKIMVIAQGKYFGIDNTCMLNLIEKLKKGEIINSTELLAITKYANQIKKQIKGHGFNCELEINRDFYKLIIKHSKKDLLFLKLLWTNELNEMLRLRLGFKIINSIRFSKFKSDTKENYNPDKPKISAVMALYNTPYNILNKTLKSILNQTFKNFELIIVDDASTFEYKKFFEKFVDPRIKYFKLDKNEGPGHARNIGIKKAIGEYVAIVDSDDIYKKKKFEVQSEFLDENTDISLLGSAFKFSNKRKTSTIIEKDEEIKNFMLFNSPFANPNMMYRKEVFSKKNLFYPENTNFGEDYALWLDAMFSGIKMANLKDILMIYVRRKNQLSKTKKDQQVSILKNLYNKIFLKLGLNASEEEINLHYNMYIGNFKKIDSEEDISNWFDKIIEYNRNHNLFNENILKYKKEQTIKSFINYQNRFFKIKLFEFNLCLYKPFKITLEKRI